MAEHTQTAGGQAPVTVADQISDREMQIRIRPFRCDYWEYHGTRAQLEAEGVIPPGTTWPEGQLMLWWEDGRFRWSLGRTRPEGLKGPMRLWTSGDWWSLRCELRDSVPGAARIKDMKRELDQEIFWRSAAGQRALRALLERLDRAHRDKAFQQFKALIPALTPPPRGSKPKAASIGRAGHV